MNTKWYEDNDPCEDCLVSVACEDDCEEKSSWRRLFDYDLRKRLRER